MLIYAIRRLMTSVPLLFLLATLTFFLLRLAPGGPFDSDRVFPPEVQANILREYGLDLPLPEQFVLWLKDAIQGDLHTSFQYISRPVTEIIAASLPVSAALGLFAFAFAVFIGIPLGAIAGARQNSWIDGFVMFISISGVSLPTYLVASLLILCFSLWLGWLPPALWEDPLSIVLPGVTLGWRAMAQLARLTRASMIEAFQSDYIRTAYGKGLGQGSVVFKHALKNSLIPVITLLGPTLANLVTGSFVVEYVFQLPGMGKHFVAAVMNRDYPLVMGVTLVYGVVLVLVNIAVDLLYGWVDPRIRLNR